MVKTRVEGTTFGPGRLPPLLRREPGPRDLRHVRSPGWGAPAGSSSSSAVFLDRLPAKSEAAAPLLLRHPQEGRSE